MGKTIIITGASDGIGRAAARVLSEAGHTIVVVGRSPEKTRATAEAVGGRHHIGDFSRLEDVRRLADELLEHYPVIDVLCNNAGGIMGDRLTTVDGHEMTFQVNHLAPFLLTKLLLPRLIAGRATVIATSSSVNRRGRIRLDDLDGQRKYSATGAYSAAKLANILFTKELHRRYADAGVAAVSFEPGPVASNFGADSTLLMRLLYHTPASRFMLSPEQGADTLVWLAGTGAGIDWSPGRHYGKRKPVKANRFAEDEVLGERLWVQTDLMAQ
ncbi:SDR family NAD(P)-dependent oxidoreductase [Mycolicibacterium peregrinum]|uniref:SDR family NAD(P)-dependent oxidoreductase n=1 Tax=Mycolicibacterium TaxID=1866885 RepID=UPI0006D8125C|nr:MULTISPECIES: SDR family NAD(P)-dependent oxidoreductase [Mycolicibacterium]MCV7205044.1 SDR family NAD(P)-dependent oxidoreductase [Mycolicibacterium peregrinum]ODR25470.1 short-chain dehydrogenase [Mycolicibacterium porcinum]ORW61064.1 short-chain dehydrogenase [Mycolicibacterium peregrinum]